MYTFTDRICANDYDRQIAALTRYLGTFDPQIGCLHIRELDGLCNIIGCVCKQIERIKTDNDAPASISDAFESFVKDLFGIATRPYQKAASTDGIIYFKQITHLFDALTSLVCAAPTVSSNTVFSSMITAISKWPDAQGSHPFVTRSEAIQALCASPNAVIALLNSLDSVFEGKLTATFRNHEDDEQESDSSDEDEDDMMFKQRGREPFLHPSVTPLTAEGESTCLLALEALNAIIETAPHATAIVLESNANVVVHCIQIRDDTPLAIAAHHLLARMVGLAVAEDARIDDFLDVNQLVETLAGILAWLTGTGYRAQDLSFRNAIIRTLHTLAQLPHVTPLLTRRDSAVAALVLGMPGLARTNAPHLPPRPRFAAAQLSPGVANHTGFMGVLRLVTALTVHDEAFVPDALDAGIVGLLLDIVSFRADLPFKWSRVLYGTARIVALECIAQIIAIPAVSDQVLAQDGVRVILGLFANSVNTPTATAALNCVVTSPQSLCHEFVRAGGISALTKAAQDPELAGPVASSALAACGIISGAIPPEDPEAVEAREQLCGHIPATAIDGLLTAPPAEAAGTLLAVAGAIEPTSGRVGADLISGPLLTNMLEVLESGQSSLRPLVLSVLADMAADPTVAGHLAMLRTIRILADLAIKEDEICNAVDTEGNTLDPARPLGVREAVGPVDPMQPEPVDLRLQLHVLLDTLESNGAVAHGVSKRQAVALHRLRQYPHLRAIEIREANRAGLEAIGVRPTTPDREFATAAADRAATVVSDLREACETTKAQYEAEEQRQETDFYQGIIDSFEQTAEALRHKVTPTHRPVATVVAP
ncbi:hypothetical protein J8273_2291 [Carpediemonas membranifera]|uniref:Uncharacterized protein n=1 Tax=Carpediemonas membranifera TaxID=201153 RepID=A0A8J6BA64_9EUKA|nr:hypothetical protein J8273_2291 [Carpediemonas membranifera]|eukprot:KAG9395942.1 hypothetical protein J8273_2291 [Carpediemonas membranifera]